MNSRNLVLLTTILITQTVAGYSQESSGQFYLDDTNTQSDQANPEASCEDLVPSIEYGLQRKANFQCGSFALRRSDWDIECFRPSMNHNPQDYIFARVGAYFECRQRNNEVQ